MITRMEKLAALLAQRLARPLIVADGALEFAAATFGVDTSHGLRELLADPDDPDGRILFEFLFFPDERMKMDLEMDLLAARLPGDAPKRIIGQLTQMLLTGLARQNLHIPFALPDGTTTHVPLDHDGARAFIERLRPTATPPSELTDAAQARFQPPFSLRLLVLLRHARAHHTRQGMDFLLRLMDSAGTESEDFLQITAFACRFLEDADHHDLLGALRARHAAARDALKAHQRFQDSFSHSNFEIQRMQGGMPAHVDAQELRRQTQLLSRICLAVYGEPVAAPGAPMSMDLGGFDGAEGAQRIIDLFESGE